MNKMRRSTFGYLTIGVGDCEGDAVGFDVGSAVGVAVGLLDGCDFNKRV